MAVKIELDESFPYLYEVCSKGNQLKFYRDGTWFKVDSFGCNEGLSEDLVSEFLKCVVNIDFAEYKSVLFTSEGEIPAKGCMSRNMYDGERLSFIPLRSLLRHLDVSPSILVNSRTISTNVLKTIGVIKEATGLDTDSYFAQLAYLDSIILNEDRHIMNVGVCYDNVSKTYIPAPIFDNGSSLFCTFWTFRGDKTFKRNIERGLATGRLFTKFHEKQVDAFLALGFRPLMVSKSMVTSLLNTYKNDAYDEEYVRRALDVLSMRLEQQVGRAFTWVDQGVLIWEVSIELTFITWKTS